MSKSKQPGKDQEPRPTQSGEEGRSPEAGPNSEQAPPSGPEPAQATESDLLARLQRVSADYLNYQKRVQREMAEAENFANAALMKELLGVLDDMERALEAGAESHGADDALLAGMRLVYEKALEVLGRYGLRPIEATGRPFDPAYHEAIMQEPSDCHETMTVLRELQRGYELRGRVIRPARVVVSAPPKAEEQPPSQDGSDSESE